VRRRLMALAVIVLVVTTRGADAASRAVTFRSPSGRMVSGSLTETDRAPAPAVILVPMLGRPKDDWQAIADRLAAAGVHALAIDLPSSGLPADLQELQGWHQDIRGAVTFLGTLNGVRPGSVGVAGASLGANLAAVAAAAEPSIRSLALISPSLDYRGVRIEGAMQQYGARQALLAASVQDPYATRSVRELEKLGSGLRTALWSSTPAHGMALLSRDPDIARTLVDWFQQTLGAVE
jgi:dienelactone hydrolase